MIWFSQVTCWYTHKNVIWQGQELVQSSCELWGLENGRLYLLVVSRTSCNWGYKWWFVFFFLLPLLLSLLPAPSSLILQLPQARPVFLLLFSASQLALSLWHHLHNLFSQSHSLYRFMENYFSSWSTDWIKQIMVNWEGWEMIQFFFLALACKGECLFISRY